MSLLIAAETCVRRYGIAKTTMGDVAAEAGVARPTVYRYFADRDQLFVAVVERRSRMLIDRAAAYIGKQAMLADKLVEGLIFLVTKGRKDDIIRLIVSPEHIHLATGLVGGSGVAADLTEALWQPILAAAVQAGELDPQIDLRAAWCGWRRFRSCWSGVSTRNRPTPTHSGKCCAPSCYRPFARPSHTDRHVTPTNVPNRLGVPC